jgi:hypothetical protein
MALAARSVPAPATLELEAWSEAEGAQLVAERQWAVGTTEVQAEVVRAVPAEEIAASLRSRVVPRYPRH